MFQSRNLTILRAIAVLMVSCAISVPAHAKYSGGTGELNDPYQIAAAADVIALGETPADYDKHFILTADIDLDPKLPGRRAFDKAVIGTFTGTLDGNGHAILHLAVEGGGYLGLFSQLESGAEVKDLGVVDVNVVGRIGYVGGLVGHNFGDVANCHASGAVSSTGLCVGGLVGANSGTVSGSRSSTAVRGSSTVGGLTGGNEGRLTNCYVTGSVQGKGSHVGGLVGENYGSITASYSIGAVSGNDDDVGGLVGFNDGGDLIACHASGTVSGERDWVGGLVGDNYTGNISNCYATGAVIGGTLGALSGGGSVGGLVGSHREGSITCCYARGSVTGMFGGVGGLVGLNADSITACYAIGPVAEMFGGVGGLVGYNNGGSLTACFWDVEVSGQDNDSGGKGLTTSQMKSVRIYRNAGWGGKGWIINDGQDYPRLAWENSGGVPIPEPEPVPLLGAGTVEDPYEVWNASEFALLSWHVSILQAEVALMADIDLSGMKLYPIGDLGSFTGVFNGNCHLIHNAVIREPQGLYVGLFGYVGHNAQIRCVGVEDATITGVSYVGGLVGHNAGACLSDCYATGSVGGDCCVGGLVGKNDGEGSMTACHARALVTGSEIVGGLVGENWFNLTNSYADGSVRGEDDVGGLIGYNTGTLTTCHAAGFVDGIKTHVGGLIGTNWGDLTACYATGRVEGGRGGVGGLIGAHHVGSVEKCYACGDVTGDGAGGLVGDNDAGSLNSCYATGSASSRLTAGGLVGSNSGNVAQCYSVGAVPDTGGLFIGGLAGYNANGGSIITSFWDIDTSGQTSSAGGTGETTAQMQTATTFLEVGWDFVGETVNGTEDVWWIDEGKDYPRLWWEAGDGASQF